MEAAKASNVIQVFNEEGERQFCHLCVHTIFHVLEEGNVPFVGTKVNCRDLSFEMVKKFIEDQLVSIKDRWADKDGTVFQKEANYKAVDTEGAEHFFVFSYHKLGSMIAWF